MKKRSFAAFCMRLRMRFLAWRAQRRGELPPDEVFFYRFNQREGLNTRKRAFWAAQAQLVEMGGALPRPARQAYMPACEMTAGARMDGLAQAYMPASGAQAYMPAYEMTADARMEGLAQAYMPAQAYAVCTRQGIAQPQAFAADDRQGSALPQAFAADDRQGSALPQAFAADDRQGRALPQAFAADDRQGLYKV